MDLTITLPSDVVAFLQKFADKHDLTLKEFMESVITEYYEYSKIHPIEKPGK